MLSNSKAMETSTLERFKLSVPASAIRDKIDELALTAVQWQSYLPIVRRDGERRAANDSGMAPLGSYDLNWPRDMDPDVGIRPRRYSLARGPTAIVVSGTASGRGALPPLQVRRLQVWFGRLPMSAQRALMKEALPPDFFSGSDASDGSGLEMRSSSILRYSSVGVLFPNSCRSR